MSTTIVGAGFAGLIAAHAWPNAVVVEAAEEPLQMHNALLRFRSDAVAKMTGMEFKAVKVNKGIWVSDHFEEPSIRNANQYAQKCLGVIRGDRSIWNLDPVTRYIAPESFYEQLIDFVCPRIQWGERFNFQRQDQTISTAPMPVVLAALGIEMPDVKFMRAPIFVERFRVPHCNAYQTIYFPTADHSVYRASITGSMLIVEHAADVPYGDSLQDIVRAFAIQQSIEPLGRSKQSYGKIDPIDDAIRKQIMFRLTHEHRIYSLGRFATWRNILLDDVVDDIAVIKRLMNASSYDLKRNLA